ncbi:MAG TPA: hypothetical protein VFU02_21425 [Polyangiaceae bacterium]|nr:hypothetical protein [Polyangiaceae bacterium]
MSAAYLRCLLVATLGLTTFGCSGGESSKGFTPGDDGTETEWAELGTGTMSGSGSTANQYEKAEVTRDGVNYLFMANGWGPNFESHSISWNGTSFTVESMLGTQGMNYEPASYPTVFCGAYSDSVSGECGLPATLDSLTSLRTGWSWRGNGSDGEYNAAYDIWLGNGTTTSTLSGYLMVWLRDPPGQQPGGQVAVAGIEVANVPGRWNIWSGTVFDRVYLAYVRAEGSDTLALEFDVLDFVRDSQMRGLDVPGTHVLSVAVGFEIWNGPVNNLESLDFFVHAQ